MPTLIAPPESFKTFLVKLHPQHDLEVWSRSQGAHLVLTWPNDLTFLPKKPKFAQKMYFWFVCRFPKFPPQFLAILEKNRWGQNDRIYPSCAAFIWSLSYSQVIGGYFEPLPFFNICHMNWASSKNSRCLSEHWYHILCENYNFVPSIVWAKITSEWRHLWLILMQNKGIQRLFSSTQLFKIKPTYLHRMMEDQQGYQTGISDFQNSEREKMTPKIVKQYIFENVS